MAASKEQTAVALDTRAAQAASGCSAAADPWSPSTPTAPARVPLARTLDAAVIPRLVLAGRVDRARRDGGDANAQANEDDRAGALAELVLARDADAARRFIDGLHDRGETFERLYLEVVAPAARRLGEFWDEDRCHFTEVTLAVLRLQQMLHLLGHPFYAEDPHGETRRRALLLPAPGEQHSLGLTMVAEFFRRAGWDVWSGAVLARPDLSRLVHRERFDLVGLSTGCDANLDGLPALIHTLRHRSRNPDLAVFVGGPAFLADPGLATAVGADATALDGRHAVAQAEELLAMRAADAAATA